MQGGDVQVESQSGQGKHVHRHAALRSRLPASAAPDRRAVPGRPCRPQPRASSGARLLLVEDNLVNQKVVLAILRKKGYQIDVANDGREALGEARSLRPSLRPGPDGRADAGAGRPGNHAHHSPRTRAGTTCPIVAMTAHAMNGDRERCLQAGMNGYISKPVQPAHLIATIEKHLRHRRRASPLPRQPLTSTPRRSLPDRSPDARATPP